MNESFKTYEITYLGQLESRKNPNPGDVFIWGSVKWLMMACPRCSFVAWLKDHEVKNDGGVITVNPSIDCPVCHAHYFVRTNKIEQLEDSE